MRTGRGDLGILLGLTLLGATLLPAWAGEIMLPTNVQLANEDDDLSGGSVKITWQPVPADLPLHKYLHPVAYRIYLGESPEELAVVNLVVGRDKSEVSQGNLRVGSTYYAQVGAVYIPPGAELVFKSKDPNQVITLGAWEFQSALAGPATTVGRWYDPKQTNVLVGAGLFSLITLLFLYLARRRDMYIRPIAGLAAVEDAIGRATEMGRPMLYVSGLSGASDIATIAAMLILGHLSQKTAPYGTDIIVPCFDPIVMTAEREIVQQAYLRAGHPEAYKPENIYYVTDSQFGYVSAVSGLMLREKPAVNFFMGYFYAESLILAETGNLTDTLQIAATDADTQLPFFIVACDYTLMGEELYAAGAYLSREPILLAQLKAQDLGKVLLGGVTGLGIILALVATFWAESPFLQWLAQTFLALFQT